MKNLSDFPSNEINEIKILNFLKKVLKNDLDLSDFSNNPFSDFFLNEDNFQAIYNTFKCNIEEKFQISSKDFSEFWNNLQNEISFFKKLRTTTKEFKNFSTTNGENLYY